MTLRRRGYLVEIGPNEAVDKSTHPTVVEYAIQFLFKGKSVEAAVKETIKKLSGSQNMFLGNGVAVINSDPLREAVWGRLVDYTIESLGRIKPGKEEYAIDGTIQYFRQSVKIREQLKRMVVEKLGRNPFQS